MILSPMLMGLDIVLIHNATNMKLFVDIIIKKERI